MKEYTITIDTGTTNTRVILWNKNRKPVMAEKTETGVRNTAIDGNNNRLKQAIHNCIQKLLDYNKLDYSNIVRIIASGMITSNVGLVEIPHICAPAGARDLAVHAKSVLLEEVCPLPILFIPGIKNSDDRVTLKNFESMDIMRGEEVESIAIMESLSRGKPYLLVLPGSHTKFVAVNSDKKIAGCLTTISGELLSAVTQNTIIANSVGGQFVDEKSYDKNMVLTGFRTAKRTGIGRACFSGRILNQFSVPDKMKIANYILGAVLENDIESVKNSEAMAANRGMTVIVSGKNPLRQALKDLLLEDGFFSNIEEFVPDSGVSLSSLGAFIVSDLL